MIITIFALLFTLLPVAFRLVSETSRLLGETNVTDALDHVLLMTGLTLAWYFVLNHWWSAFNSLISVIVVGFVVVTLTEIAQACWMSQPTAWGRLAAALLRR